VLSTVRSHGALSGPKGRPYRGSARQDNRPGSSDRQRRGIPCAESIKELNLSYSKRTDVTIEVLRTGAMRLRQGESRRRPEVGAMERGTQSARFPARLAISGGAWRVGCRSRRAPRRRLTSRRQGAWLAHRSVDEREVDVSTRHRNAKARPLIAGPAYRRGLRSIDRSYSHH